MTFRAASGGWGRAGRMGSSGKAAAWTPANAPPGTFMLWLDGADRSTYTTSSGRVSRMTDKSGAGNHAIQTDPAFQPLDATTGFTNDGGRVLASNLSASNNDETLFIVALFPSVTGTITMMGPTDTAGRQFRVQDGNLQVVRSFAAQEATTSNAPVPVNVLCIVEMQLQMNAQTKLGVNGVLQDSGLKDSSFISGWTTRIMANKDANEAGPATYKEILSLPTKPSAALATQIRTYLKNKWNIT